MLDRKLLETFATVAEQQSLERAAAVLHVTRGAVSQRIRSLEESLATVLLLRDKPVTPTAAGEVLLRHVKYLRLLEASSLRELPSYGSGPSQCLPGAQASVGISAYAAVARRARCHKWAGKLGMCGPKRPEFERIRRRQGGASKSPACSA